MFKSNTSIWRSRLSNVYSPSEVEAKLRLKLKTEIFFHSFLRLCLQFQQPPLGATHTQWPTTGSLDREYDWHHFTDK